MAAKLHSPEKILNSAESQAKALILLALWDLESSDTEVKRTEVTNRVKRGKEKVDLYKDFLDQLEQDGAVAIKKERIVKVALSKPRGLEILNQELRNSKFFFEGFVKVWAANALLKWIREIDVQTITEIADNSKSLIKSYKEFKQAVLEVYERLDLDNLVPIYRIRREIGERVARKNFNEWLLEMQSNDIVQLVGGEMPDSTPDKVEDSIKIDLGGSQSALRYYVQRLDTKR